MRRSSGGHSEQRQPSVISVQTSPEQQSPERVISEIGPEASEPASQRARAPSASERGESRAVWGLIRVWEQQRR
ncbi:hypothetical protein DY000_02007339 [Brassica cretica]|uniref:Uncharacterized protein n=1 Tax=Brassica cretica TaxID=69181 RepID=A0ABQ7C2H1_BRACR|nr:hypothetical protein DY000_02007339 [Brassica cretica]